jgi:hypothetical protein
MPPISSILSFIFVFFSLMIFVFVSMALINMWTKSYQPRFITPFVIIIVVLYFSSTAIAYDNIRKTIDRMGDRLQNRTEQRQTTPGGNRATF